MAERTIEIPQTITVGNLAEKLELPVTQLITELMKNGVIATVNENIDFDTAQIITQELGLDVELTKPAEEEPKPLTKKKPTAKAKGQPRPLVVSVMGHVDHGKTSLLDAIRDSKVTETEAGGITQHISAYQIEHKKRVITFLDTPGHEAFAALREHGAYLTDMALLVVAADDGVKPQTKEAIRYAQKAGIKIVVAINKIDKPGADITKVKQQLADSGVMVEGWGGDIVALEVSAKTKQGIEQMLDILLLSADIEELSADPNLPARGVIIESHLKSGQGAIAVGLVQEGTLKSGQFIVAGSTYAKVKTLETTDGKKLDKALPSTPAVISGFKALPDFGEEFEQVDSERIAKNIARDKELAAKFGSTRQTIASSELIRKINRASEVAELPVIIKADSKGSLSAVNDSLKSLNTQKVVVRIIKSEIGAISESDIHLAASGGTIIYGFNIIAPPAARKLAVRDKVSLKIFNIIYELIDDVKEEMTKLLSPVITETEIGRLIIKGVFKLTKNEVICGGEVTKGPLSLPALATVMRDKKQLAQVEIVSLKKGPTEVSSVEEGQMCGVSFKTKARVPIKEGDRLEFFRREEEKAAL